MSQETVTVLEIALVAGLVSAVVGVGSFLLARQAGLIGPTRAPAVAAAVSSLARMPFNTEVRLWGSPGKTGEHLVLYALSQRGAGPIPVPTLGAIVVIVSIAPLQSRQIEVRETLRELVTTPALSTWLGAPNVIP